MRKLINTFKKLSFVLLLTCPVISACSKSDDPDGPGSGDTKTFELKVQTYAALEEQIEFKVAGVSSGEVTVNYGDGTSEVADASKAFSHKYSAPGNYNISVQSGKTKVTKQIEIGPLKALSVLLPELRSMRVGNKSTRVLIMSHRAHVTDVNYPENSVSAVGAAVAEGSDFLELDVHLTKDDSLVVCHDNTIDATTTGSGKIADLTYSQIQSYNLRNRVSQPTNEKMPTLREYLLASRGKAYIDIDMGTTSAREIAKVVNELGMMEQVVWSASVSQVAAISLYAPKAHYHMWQDDYKSVGQYLKYPPYTTQYHCKPGYYVTARGTAVADGNVIVVNILYTTFPELVPEFEIKKDQIDYLFNNCPEVSIIQTDCPKELRAELKSRGLHD